MTKAKVVNFAARTRSARPDQDEPPSMEQPAPSKVFEVIDQLQLGSFRIDDVIESLSDGFALYDPDDRLVMWNRKFGEILYHAKDIMYPGIPFEQLVRKCAQEQFAGGLITEETRDAWLEEARRFQRNSETYERFTPDGKCYFVSRRRSAENFTAVVWTDITDRKRSEKALQESEELYRALVEQSAQGIVVTTRRKLLTVNRTFLKLFGLKSSKDIKTASQLEQLLCTNDRAKFRNIKRLHWTGQDVAPAYEFQARNRKDGKDLWVHATFTKIQWKDEEALQITFLDVTQKKQFTEDLIALKLETVGTMARGIAMEFQKVTSAIMSQVRLAKMEAYATGNEAVYDALSQAEQFGSNAEDLTDQLLFLYRGGHPFKEPATIEELIKRALPDSDNGENSVVFLHNNRKKAEIKIRLAGRLPTIRVDKRQIVQVFQSLIENGLSAMPFGGTLKVLAERVDVADKTRKAPLVPGRYVKVSIVDQGEGLPQDSLNRIFDPYFSTKHMSVGTTLATAFSIVKRHEGTITVSSQVGRGTRLNVFIPAEVQP